MVCVKEKKPPGPSCSQQIRSHIQLFTDFNLMQQTVPTVPNFSRVFIRVDSTEHLCLPRTIIFIIQPLTELLLVNGSGSGIWFFLPPGASALPGALAPPYTTLCKAPPHARLSLKVVQIRSALKNYLIFCVNTRELFSADIINGEI